MLAIKQLKKALIMVIISALIGTSVTVLIALLFGNQMQFMTIRCYLIGAFAAFITCISMRGILREKSYFDQAELKNGKGFWIDKIRNRKFVNKTSARLMLVPYIVLGLGIMVAICIFDKQLQSGSSYIGRSALCALLAAVSVALVTYAVLSMFSIKACKKCGAVNALILTENAEHISSVAYASYRMSASPVPLISMLSPIRGRVENHCDFLICHCASCGEEETVTQFYGSDWSAL